MKPSLGPARLIAVRSILAGRRLVIVVAVVAAVTVAAGAAAATLALTGASSQQAAAPTTAPPSTTTTTTATTTTAPPQTTTTTAAPAPSTTAGIPACGAADLAITTSDTSSATGHSGFVLLFRNTGPSECQVGSYPGIDADLANGQQLAAQRTLRGFMGGEKDSGTITAVVLAPGAVASSLVETSGNNTGTQQCVQVTAYDVTPPDTTTTSRLAGGGEICAYFQVHPIVAGTTGSSGQ